MRLNQRVAKFLQKENAKVLVAKSNSTSNVGRRNVSLIRKKGKILRKEKTLQVENKFKTNALSATNRTLEIVIIRRERSK